jgi:primase-polymerase (primpol)-like protein
LRKTYVLEGIPDELKDLRGWLYWVGGKVPKTLWDDPATGKSNHNNPACLASLPEVLERIGQFRCRHGLAFSFRPEFGLTYVDLDDCRDPATGELTLFAAEIVRRLNSYTEVSIGRKGLHIVARGQVPKPRMHTKRNWAGRQIEMKPHSFYMTVSGDHLAGTPRTVEERQAELMQIYEEIFGADAKQESKPRSKPERTASPAGPSGAVDFPHLFHGSTPGRVLDLVDPPPSTNVR